jgi:hypothetical protein
MSASQLWSLDSPRFARRDVLKQMAAAGLAAGLPAFPALAQDKSAAQPALAETLALCGQPEI